MLQKLTSGKREVHHKNLFLRSSWLTTETKARRANLSLRHPACLETTPISQKFTGILEKWQGKKTFLMPWNLLSWIIALVWAKQLLGTSSFIAVYIEYCCKIYNHTMCFVLFCFVSPNTEKQCSRCKKMFSLQILLASWTSIHIWWVAGRLCALKPSFLGGEQVRELRDAHLFLVTWTGLPVLCLILLQSLSSTCWPVSWPIPKHTVPAPFTVCSCNTKNPQKTIWECGILTSLLFHDLPAMV